MNKTLAIAALTLLSVGLMNYGMGDSGLNY